MNGRVYDPIIGRFASADPFVQFPESTQGLNRYSYVNNNPLSYTDPSGFGIFSKIKKWLARNEVARTVLAIAVNFIPVIGQGLSTYIAGFASGLISSAGDIKQGFIGAFTAGAFNVAGAGFVGKGPLGGVLNNATISTQVIVHGTIGGISSELSGGEFGSGFLSAAIPKAFSDKIGNIGHGAEAYKPARIMVAAMVGGTASKLGGGKFANGAVTAAFSRAFNDEAHRGGRSQGITEEQRQLAAAGNVGGFWESRQAMGDPIAGVALDSLNPSGGPIDYLFRGTSINNRLQAFGRVYGGGELNIDQVRVELMRAHVIAVDADTRGVVGLLNPRQVAAYHHSVFAGHGLPPTTFGGTPFTGALWEATATRSIWCGGCDR